MKRQIIIPVMILFLLTASHFIFAQEEITVVAPTSEVAEGLDLHAVAELFKESENLEEFEQYLNDPEIGINNLDLDGDGYIDYIRVVEQVTDYTHVIILQVPLGEDEFQDIATIEIEKTGDEDYNMQVRGNEIIYGTDYYVTPAYVHVYRWPIIIWLYRPYYRPYRSVFYFGYYPHWWRPYHRVTVHVYHTHTVHYTRRASFERSRVSRVKTVHKVNYKPRTSTRLKQNERVARPDAEPKPTPIINKPTRPREEAITVKKDINTTYQKKIETTDKTEARKRIKPRIEKDATDRSGVSKTTKPDIKRKTNYNSEVKRTAKPTISKTTKPKLKKSTTAKTKVKKSTTIKKPVKKSTKPKVEKKTTVKKDDKKTTVKKKK